jgi:hypothetical protein
MASAVRGVATSIYSAEPPMDVHASPITTPGGVVSYILSQENTIVINIVININIITAVTTDNSHLTIIVSITIIINIIIAITIVIVNIIAMAIIVVIISAIIIITVIIIVSLTWQMLYPHKGNICVSVTVCRVGAVMCAM